MTWRGLIRALALAGLLTSAATLGWAEPGAGGSGTDLGLALFQREAGDTSGARVAAEAAAAAAADPAAAWEARLALALIDLEEGARTRAAAEAEALAAEGARLFGADAPRLSAPLAILGTARGDTATLLRAARLGRAGYGAAIPDDGVITDARAMADQLAALAALADHLLGTGDGAAAALIAAELVALGSGTASGVPPRWQDGAMIAALHHLRAGDPVEGLTHALPVLDLDYAPDTARARRLTDAFIAEIEVAAAAEGDVDAVFDGWWDQAILREEAMLAADAKLAEGIADLIATQGTGDAVAADRAGRAALATVRADNAVVVHAYLALLGVTMNARRFDLAETWARRIVELPPAYVASLAYDPIPFLAQLAFELSSRGAYPAAVVLAEGVAVLAPLRNRDAQATVAALAALGATYSGAGRRAQAEAAFAQALALAPVSAGMVPHVIEARVGRALLRLVAGDLARAEADVAAALALLDTTAEGGQARAWVYVGGVEREVRLAQGDVAGAEAAARRTLARVTALAGAQSGPAAVAGFELAQTLLAAGRTAEAGAEVQRAAAAAQAGLPPDDALHGRIAGLAAAVGVPVAAGPAAAADDWGYGAALALAEAAARAAAADDLDGAVAALDRALAALDPEAPIRSYFEGGKGDVLWKAGRAEAALVPLREATRALTQPERRGEPQARMYLPLHVAAALALSETATGAEALNLFTEAFQVAQRVDDLSAGAALGRATARSLGPGPEAAAAARRLEDAGRALTAARQGYLDVLARGGDTVGPRRALTRAREGLAAVEAEVRAAFPDYAALADPRPVDLVAAMRLLGPDEVLVVFASAPGVDPPGQVFALTATGYMAAPLPPRDDLARLARDLRCAAALTDRHCGAAAGATRGAFTLGDAADAGPSFDFATAHAAWEALFAPVAAALDGKRALIVVPDRTLSSLPFHLALTAPPGPATTPREAPWLLRRMAVTVVPSVASLAALRGRAAPPAGDLPFLGVGDPLIGAQAAGPLPYECGDAAPDLLAAALVPPGGPILRNGGVADPQALIALPALPDTRCELARKADLFGPGSRVILHGQATEAALKAMSADGGLARYRVLSFATHGLIAGEVGAQDAGLVLTPPALPGADDDGLLTTAEIAALRLDADFVILSACNTASGSSETSEGLAGLASAFFLAGARGLLVSHWPVYSDAATELTTAMLAATAAPDRPGRAEALRRAVLSILDDPAADRRRAHPAYWAPFMVVGDGRAGQG
jgi:CHAT domain-containing protein